MRERLVKLLSYLLVGVCIVGIFSGCFSDTKSVDIGRSTTKSSDDKQEEQTGEQSTDGKSDIKLVKDGVLTVGMDIDYPPFESFADNGVTPIGIDIDLSRAIAKEIGLDVEFVNVSWDELFKNIGKDYDIVCSAVTITEDRKKDMLFSIPYIDNCQAVVVRADSDLKIDNFSMLDGLKVAVQKGTVSDDLIKEYVEAGEFTVNLMENEVATDCFTQLKDKKVDAIVCDSTVADGQITRNSKLFKEAYRDLSSLEEFGIGISKDNKVLQSKINEALETLEKEKKISLILESWFGGDI